MNNKVAQAPALLTSMFFEKHFNLFIHAYHYHFFSHAPFVSKILNLYNFIIEFV